MDAFSLLDAAFGSVIGACVGDAAGGVLEFWGSLPTPEDVDHAMTMPGGGVFNLAPGQITDDGELTISLAQALQTSIFSLEAIAQRYAEWVNSSPFDIGITTRYSLGSVQNATLVKEYGSYSATMIAMAAAHCMESKANGSLMRATPLAVWGHRLRNEDLATIARQDSSLSHPNPTCGDAVACYILAIAHLLNHCGDREGAFLRAANWARDHANNEVNEWLQMAKQQQQVDYLVNIGFVKIAFIAAFQHLLLGSNYEQAIRQVLLRGGDTDTNACIVGGMIGAASGVRAIPSLMVQAMLQCKTAQGEQRRPKFLSTNKQIDYIVKKMLLAAPINYLTNNPS